MDEENPWAVEQLEDFLFFCCPECPDRIPTKETFIEHALSNHSLSRDVLPNVKVTTVIDIKEEIVANAFTEKLLLVGDDDYFPPIKKTRTPRHNTVG
jgi:hypothetical protein